MLWKYEGFVLNFDPKKKKKIHITLSLEEFGWATLKWVSDQGS